MEKQVLADLKKFREAHREGDKAHHDGKPVTDNPYPDLNDATGLKECVLSDPLYGGWNAGWIEREWVTLTK